MSDEEILKAVKLLEKKICSLLIASDIVEKVGFSLSFESLMLKTNNDGIIRDIDSLIDNIEEFYPKNLFCGKTLIKEKFIKFFKLYPDITDDEIITVLSRRVEFTNLKYVGKLSNSILMERPTHSKLHKWIKELRTEDNVPNIMRISNENN